MYRVNEREQRLFVEGMRHCAEILFASGAREVIVPYEPVVRLKPQDDLGAIDARGLKPVSLLVWPEVPAPFYYYEDPVFRQRVNQLARALRAYFLLGVVAHTPRGAPLNSAVLVSPTGTAVNACSGIECHTCVLPRSVVTATAMARALRM